MKITENLMLATRMISKARTDYKVSYIPVLIRFIEAHGKGFSPTEIAEYELLNIRYKKPGIKDHVSKEELLRVQALLNPTALSDDTENKQRFDEICQHNDLPVPRLVAQLINERRPGEPVSDISYADEEHLVPLLSDLGEGEYVIKPSDGCYGAGIFMFSHAGTSGEQRITAKAISDHLAQFEQFRNWVVQERLINHPDIMSLSPSKALQTVRVVTCVEKDGQVHVLAAQWRLASSHSQIDNFSFGRNQGLLCNLFTDNGQIEICYRGKDYPLEFGLELHSTHPETGNTLVGKAIPHWEAVLELSRRAAACFMPSRSIGWDIAVTDRGPILIEGNRYWDPHSEDGRMRERLQYLLQQAG